MAFEIDRDTARQTIRARWREIAPNYLQPAKKKGQFICPMCGHGANGDGLTHNPKSKDGNGLKCFGGGCNWSGDIIDLIQIVQGVDYNTALKMAAADIGLSIAPNRSSAAADFSEAAKKLQQAQEGQKTGVSAAAEEIPKDAAKAPENAPEAPPQADYTAYYKECMERLEDPAAVSYLSARGISLDTARRYLVGFDPIADPANAPGATGNDYRPYPAPRLILPVSKSYYIGRRTDGGEDYKKMNARGGSGIFNLKALQDPSNKTVFVVEGYIDALSIIQVGAAAVGLNSANNRDRFIKYLEEHPTDATIIICLDNDNPGQTATRKIKHGLKTLHIPFITANICAGCKDPNEALTSDLEGFKKAIQAAQEAAEHEGNKDDLSSFWEKIQTTAYRPHETGLEFFDKLLGGGVIMQTVLLVLAAPATGKTTLCQTLAEEIAKRGKPVIYLNLEMSKEQMLAKAISARVSKADPAAPMTTNDILQGYKWTEETRQRVYKALEDYRANVFPYIKYNPEEIGSDLDTMLGYLGRVGEEAQAEGKPAPAVVLDYLHLVTGGGETDIQERLKKAVNGIKSYCKEYDTFGIIISAIHRLGKGQITMESGRDSSNIEFGGDAMISLNYAEIDSGAVDPTKESEFAPLKMAPYRHMILRILKARFYQAGRSARCYYHPATNLFFGENEFLPVIGDDKITPFPEPEKQRQDTKEKLRRKEEEKRANIPRRG